jgi:SPP1 gp7 family putative phage head morphogenesis protein
MKEAVQAYLDVQKAKWLEDIARVQLPVVIQKEEITDPELANILKAMESAVVLGMTTQNNLIQALPQISIDIGINSEFVTNYLKTRSASLISWIDETTRQEIQTLIDEAFKTGMSIDDLASKITNEFYVFSDYRAELIAQMETANAFETWKLEQFKGYEKQTGATGWKRAYTQGDDNVRKEHQTNADKGWIRSYEMFATGHETAPFWFNCRCTVVFSLVNPDTWSLF